MYVHSTVFDVAPVCLTTGSNRCAKCPDVIGSCETSEWDNFEVKISI